MCRILSVLTIFLCILLLFDIAEHQREVKQLDIKRYMKAYEHGLMNGYNRGYDDRVLYELEHHVVILPEPSSGK